jgi:hypothetical protein
VTVVHLAVPFVDTSAAALRWHLDDRPRAALAVRAVRLGTIDVELRVLGASHQVIVRDGDATVGELVACGEDGATLPSARCHELDAHTYALSSTVRLGSRVTIHRAVNRLVRAAADHERAVVAAYPGDADAVTAIAVDATPSGGLRWRTWHAYPRTGELVVTRTVLERR